jgi:parallel beta-helix repeat protein
VAGTRTPETRAIPALTLLVILFALSGARSPADPCTLRLSPKDDLQQAIDGAGARSGRIRVCLSAGEHRLPHLLAVERDDTTLTGEGPATLLRLETGVDSPVLVVGDYRSATPRRPVSNVVVERLRIVGGGAGGSELHGRYPYLTNSAVVVRAGRGITLRDLDVSECRSACILTERDTHDVAIEKNRVRGSVWDGISLNRTTRARLVDNDIRDNTAAGITAEHLEDSLVDRNVVARNRTHGVYLSDSYRNAFRDNRFVDNVLSAVFLTCAVREREPPVACWQDSMSQGNDFARNTIVGNRVGFTEAPDARATCAAPGFVANRSRGDLFSRNPRDERPATAYGRCLRFAALSRAASAAPAAEPRHAARSARTRAPWPCGPSASAPGSLPG